MWQRFTERARRVILLGQEEAGKLNSGHVGTEHLLLGLARENEGIAAQVLAKMGVSLAKIRTEIEAHSQSDIELAAREPKLTPRAKRALELAADEARRMSHNYIGTEHLLLALLREKDGSAATILRRLGFKLDETRTQVIEYLGSDAPAVAGTFHGALSGATVADEQSRVAPAIREVLALAAQQSRESGSSRVEIIHLLRALCHEESESARVLSEAGVDIEALRAQLK